MRSVWMSLGAVALLAAPQIAFAQKAEQSASTGPAKVQVEKKAPFGEYLTDSQGRALYMFTADSKGQSNCYDKCAQAWPPLATKGQPKAGKDAKEAELGTIDRRGGGKQVTYNGMPLYYFKRDTGAGQVKGQDVHGFGGEWYLVSPSGEKIEAKAKKKGS